MLQAVLSYIGGARAAVVVRREIECTYTDREDGVTSHYLAGTTIACLRGYKSRSVTSSAETTQLINVSKQDYQIFVSVVPTVVYV